MLASVLALIALQSGGEGSSWAFERDLAVSESLRIAIQPESCLERADNRQFLAERVRALGLSPGRRSVNARQALNLVTEPQRHSDRLIYHYLSIGSALCAPMGEANYPCLNAYAARIEAPVGPDGQPMSRGALNDPDRTTLALMAAAREIARRCGHLPERDDL